MEVVEVEAASPPSAPAPIAPVVRVGSRAEPVVLAELIKITSAGLRHLETNPCSILETATTDGTGTSTTGTSTTGTSTTGTGVVTTDGTAHDSLYDQAGYCTFALFRRVSDSADPPFLSSSVRSRGNMCDRKDKNDKKGQLQEEKEIKEKEEKEEKEDVFLLQMATIPLQKRAQALALAARFISNAAKDCSKLTKHLRLMRSVALNGSINSLNGSSNGSNTNTSSISTSAANTSGIVSPSTAAPQGQFLPQGTLPLPRQMQMQMQGNEAAGRGRGGGKGLLLMEYSYGWLRYLLRQLQLESAEGAKENRDSGTVAGSGSESVSASPACPAKASSYSDIQKWLLRQGQLAAEIERR